METAPDEKHRYFLQSLAKGLKVLQCMAQAPHALSLTEIARAVGTNNATATRCCHTLATMGFIRRDHKLRYHLTPRLLALGYAAVRGLDWRDVARQYLRELSDQIGETVNLSVLDQGEIIYIIRIKTVKILPYDLRIGSRLPVYCTSMGKALMAFLPPEQVERILEGVEFTPLTHRTITDRQIYLEELERVRRQGYAINDEELSVGLRSVAAPILDSRGLASAALNIAVPTTRVSRPELEERLAPLAMTTARDISGALEALEQE